MLFVLFFNIGHYVYSGLAWIHYVVKDDPVLLIFLPLPFRMLILRYIYLFYALLGMEPGIMHAKKTVYQPSYIRPLVLEVPLSLLSNVSRSHLCLHRLIRIDPP